ncbi:ATP-dependent DNA ligase [Streptomyces sp. NPDC008343]|uniref:ATP-dependent DNA ligase n=1 Tax=Streptomyces sp. NPDC008343 TaxID=3364828 RepID=UPI0036E7C244
MSSTWSLPKPMLATLTPDPTLQPGHAAEPKRDGFRALFSMDAGRVVLRSRRGTDLAPVFLKIVTGARGQLPSAAALDRELVVRDNRTATVRAPRSGCFGAAWGAGQRPAHAVAFDVLRLADQDTTAWPYRRHRAALETLFTENRLTALWALCPSTTDPDMVTEWPTWTAVGLEGLLFKQLDSPNRPSVRGWRKCKVRESRAAIVEAITGALTAPRSLLPGRLDTGGRLRDIGAPRPPVRGRRRRPDFPERRRAPLDRLDVLRRVGNDEHLECHPAYSPTWSRKSTSTSTRPGQRRPEGAFAVRRHRTAQTSRPAE